MGGIAREQGGEQMKIKTNVKSGVAIDKKF
jgi:hypothetical protein